MNLFLDMRGFDEGRMDFEVFERWGNGYSPVFFTNSRIVRLGLNCGEYVWRNSSSMFKCFAGVLHEVAALVGALSKTTVMGTGRSCAASRYNSRQTCYCRCCRW